MPDPQFHSGPRHEHERVHERAADPAEAANRPLEPKSSQEPLSAADEPAAGEYAESRHPLDTPVGEVDPDADSDPYRRPTPEDDADRASGTRTSGQGEEDR